MEASAPGKLIVTGEYAVLEGAPAVVMAVNRRATVSLRPTGDRWTLQAPELGIRQAAFSVSSAGCRWETVTGEMPTIVNSVFALLARQGIVTPQTPPASITTQTTALWDAQSGAKLGFGSSAAVTTALVRILLSHAKFDQYQWESFDPDLLSLLRSAHDHGQGKAGSGADVAASLLGGVLVYSNQKSNPYARTISLPEGLLWLAVWTGTATSTAAQLQTLGRFSEAEPATYQTQMRALRQRANAAALACSEGRVERTLEELIRYRDQVASLGKSAGIDIFSQPHRKLAALGEACNVAYKPSGAGGGDLGLAFSTSPSALAEFAERARGQGFQPLMDLNLDPKGTLLRPETKT